MAAIVDPKAETSNRPMVRITFPLDRVKYENKNGKFTLDITEGLWPIKQDETTAKLPESYDPELGLDDFLKTLKKLNLQVYFSIDSLPRQQKNECKLGSTTCLAYDPVALSSLSWCGYTRIAFNPSRPKDYDYVFWDTFIKDLTNQLNLLAQVDLIPRIKWWSIGNEPFNNGKFSDRLQTR